MSANWNEYITCDPAIMAGKPIVRNTRLSVDFLLSLAAEGWTQQQIIENYPALDSNALQAAFAFAAQHLRDESLYPLQDAG